MNRLSHDARVEAEGLRGARPARSPGCASRAKVLTDGEAAEPIAGTSVGGTPTAAVETPALLGTALRYRSRIVCAVARQLLAIWMLGGGSVFSQTSPAPEAETTRSVRAVLGSSTNSSYEPIGPIWFRRSSDGISEWSLAPLLSHSEDPSTDSASFDALYPILTFDRFGSEYRFQLFQLLNFSGGTGGEGGKEQSRTLFPFYFQQSSSDGASNSFALAPFFGTIRNRLFREQIQFVLFPLYSSTRRHGVTTWNYLYPFFHVRRGAGVAGWQFWPLIGREHKDATVETNSVGEPVTVGGYDKDFALWPIYFKDTLEIGTTNQAQQTIFLPFFSSENSPTRRSMTYPWPLGFTFTDDANKRFREWGAPWPFVVFARGEGQTVNRVWPIFSVSHNAELATEVYLWPFYRHTHAIAPPLDQERTRLFYFLYSDLVEKNTAAGTTLRRTDLWPLFTAKRDHEGRESLQVLALLSPLFPENASIERNYSSLWSLWRQEGDPIAKTSSESFLLNLYRVEKAPDSTIHSFLFGLLQFKSGAEKN